MSRPSKFFIGSLFLCLFLSSPFIYKQLTQGFRLGKLYRPKKGQELSCAIGGDISSLLDGPFSYLGRGMQAFVFERGDVVIKLFRIRSKNHQKSLAKTFAACELAFHLAREETGLLAIHLHPTEGQWPCLELKNRFGFSWKVPLDDYCFVLQKKTKPFEQTLLHALKEKKAGPLIDSFLQLIDERAQRGICNTDIHIKRNFGFLGEKAVEIDFGNYVYSPEKQGSEFRKFSDHLRELIQKQAPEYLLEYDRKVESFYAEKNS